MERFWEFEVGGRTYYKNRQLDEKKVAEAAAQALADQAGDPVEMTITKGWLERDPSGFVYDSEEEDVRTRTFRPKKKANGRGRAATMRNPAGLDDERIEVWYDSTTDGYNWIVSVDDEQGRSRVLTTHKSKAAAKRSGQSFAESMGLPLRVY